MPTAGAGAGAGAGIRGGFLHGTFDGEVAYPVEKSVNPEDLAKKMIYWSLGFNPDLFIRDREDPPIPVIESGKALKELFGCVSCPKTKLAGFHKLGEYM